MNWTPEQYWEFVAGLVGNFEHNQMRDALTERGLSIVPQAAREPWEIDELKSKFQPSTAALERAALSARIKAHGPQAVSSILHAYATTSPPEGSFAGSLWAISEWISTQFALSPTNPPAEVVARAERGTP